MIGKSLLPEIVLTSQLPSEFWTAIGALLVIGGVVQIVFRQQELRDRQRSYDASRWWSYPPVWREHAIIVLGGLLALALGIVLIVSSLTLAPLSE